MMKQTQMDIYNLIYFLYIAIIHSKTNSCVENQTCLLDAWISSIDRCRHVQTQGQAHTSPYMQTSIAADDQTDTDAYPNTSPYTRKHRHI